MKNKLPLILLAVSISMTGCASFTPAHEFVDVTIQRLQNLAISNEKASIYNVYGFTKLLISFYPNETDRSKKNTVQQLKLYCSNNGISLNTRSCSTIEAFNAIQYSVGYIENGDFYLFPNYYSELVIFPESGFISPLQTIQVKAEGTLLKIVCEE